MQKIVRSRRADDFFIRIFPIDCDKNDIYEIKKGNER